MLQEGLQGAILDAQLLQTRQRLLCIVQGTAEAATGFRKNGVVLGRRQMACVAGAGFGQGEGQGPDRLLGLTLGDRAIQVFGCVDVVGHFAQPQALQGGQRVFRRNTKNHPLATAAWQQGKHQAW